MNENQNILYQWTHFIANTLYICVCQNLGEARGAKLYKEHFNFQF